MKVMPVQILKPLMICLAFTMPTNLFGFSKTHEMIEDIEQDKENWEEQLEKLRNSAGEGLFENQSVLAYLIDNDHQDAAMKLLDAEGSDYQATADEIKLALSNGMTGLAMIMLRNKNGYDLISDNNCLLVYILERGELERYERHYLAQDLINRASKEPEKDYLYHGMQLKLLNILIIFEEEKRVEELLASDTQLEHSPYTYTLDEDDSTRADIVKKLIKNGYEIDIDDQEFGTRLHRAVSDGDLNFIIALLKQGADINAINEKNQTPLSLSLGLENRKILQTLIAKGAKPNQIATMRVGLYDEYDYEGSPLRYAIEKYNYELLFMLLKSEHIKHGLAQQIMNCMPEHEMQKFAGAEEALKLIGASTEQEDVDDDFSSYQSSRFLSYGGVKKKKFEEAYAGQVAEEIEEFRKFLNSQDDRIFNYDPSFKQTVLFHGPTGTGKTTLAYAIAAESGLPFFKLEANEVETKYLGDSERYLAQIFKDLYDFATVNDTKVVLFIDEIDNLLSSRGGEESTYEAYHYKLVSVFLNYFGENEHDDKRNDFLKKVVLIGATNYLEKIPENVKSRFFVVSEIPNPDKELRIKILSYHLGKIKQGLVDLSEQEIYEIAAIDCEGFNGRQIADNLSSTELYRQLHIPV
ncbi:MAG: AAA family ATPase [Oligoflexales bacterium]|nr:AAA family ATPase [Oligoflexales bacterium]